MNCNVGDIIVIDGKQNMVLTNFLDNGNTYSFINELLDDLSNITDVYYVVKHLPGGAYEKLVDVNEIDRLYPKIQEGLKESMKANGLDPEEVIKMFNEEVNNNE